MERWRWGPYQRPLALIPTTCLFFGLLDSNCFFFSTKGGCEDGFRDTSFLFRQVRVGAFSRESRLNRQGTKLKTQIRWYAVSMVYFPRAATAKGPFVPALMQDTRIIRPWAGRVDNES